VKVYRPGTEHPIVDLLLLEQVVQSSESLELPLVVETGARHCVKYADLTLASPYPGVEIAFTPVGRILMDSNPGARRVELDPNDRRRSRPDGLFTRSEVPNCPTWPVDRGNLDRRKEGPDASFRALSPSELCDPSRR
jgi:hypothetical protein